MQHIRETPGHARTGARHLVRFPPLSAILLHMAALTPLISAALIPGVLFGS
jgi:hypothetical protein